MNVKQISVFLENKTGRLYNVLKALSDANVNIRALSLADTTDFGILRLIVDDPDHAQSLLKELGFTLGLSDVVVVQVEDKPGALSVLLKLLRDANVNVEYMYAFAQNGMPNSTFIFRFDKTDVAVSLFETEHIRMLSSEQIATS